MPKRVQILMSSMSLVIKVKFMRLITIICQSRKKRSKLYSHLYFYLKARKTKWSHLQKNINISISLVICLPFIFAQHIEILKIFNKMSISNPMKKLSISPTAMLQEIWSALTCSQLEFVLSHLSRSVIGY